MADYGMFSKSGANRVSRMVESAKKKAANTKISRETVVAFLKKTMRNIAKNHGEVFDTDVREQVAYALDKSFDERRWDRPSVYDDLAGY